MKLPYYENCIVAEAKLTKYLLDEFHEDGRTKAVFFMRFGFSLSKWEVLAEALKQHAFANEVVSILETARGKHYAVEGELHTPSGRSPFVRSIWAVETGSSTPRLITAYPVKVK